MLFVKTRDALKMITHLDLFSIASGLIIRHVKIQAHATPYGPTFFEYFARRAKSRKINNLSWPGATATRAAVIEHRIKPLTPDYVGWRPIRLRSFEDNDNTPPFSI